MKRFFSTFWKRLQALPPFLWDPQRSVLKKALAAFGFVYLVFPFDIIPWGIPFVHLLDDLLVWSLILYILRDDLDSYGVSSHGTSFREGRYRGKTVIDADYEIKNEEEDKNV